MSTIHQADRRRGGRITHKARIIISGADTSGLSFAEDTETITVSKHGACARTRYTLKMGQEVSIRTKEHDRVGQLVVVWLGKAGTPREGMVGLEWVEPRRFWGVDFPPEDWGVN
jgi:hypothetical protein